MNTVTSPARLAIAGLLAVVSMTAAADITFVTWAGIYTKSQQKAYGEPWEKATGSKVHWQKYNGGLGEIRAQVELGEVTWDIVNLSARAARSGCEEGLFHEVPYAKFTKAADGTPMDDDLLFERPNDCVVPNVVWSWMAFYGANHFPGAKPATIADFFDLRKFPGPRAIGTFARSNIEMALVADGVEPRKVYEVMSTAAGIDRAFAKLDTIREAAVFWSTGAEPQEFVLSGKAVMATGYNGRLGAEILEGADSLVPIWDGQVLEEEWFVIVKGSKNYGEALEFLVHATAPEQQAAQMKWMTYGPMRRSALDIIAANEPWYHNGRDVLPHVPDREELLPRSVIASPEWWLANGPEITKRFKAWREQ